jgi:hypothetical protein
LCFSVFRQSTRYEFTISIAPRIIFRKNQKEKLKPSEISDPPNWNKKNLWNFDEFGAFWPDETIVEQTCPVFP